MMGMMKDIIDSFLLRESCYVVRIKVEETIS